MLSATRYELIDRALRKKEWEPYRELMHAVRKRQVLRECAQQLGVDMTKAQQLIEMLADPAVPFSEPAVAREPASPAPGESDPIQATPAT